VYIRHGADRKHWSNWMLMTPGKTGLHVRFSSHDPHPTDQSTYTITLQVPMVDRKRFGALYQDWKKADPNWDDDVDAPRRAGHPVDQEATWHLDTTRKP
jgi:hypothetical protein